MRRSHPSSSLRSLLGGGAGDRFGAQHCRAGCCRTVPARGFPEQMGRARRCADRSFEQDPTLEGSVGSLSQVGSGLKGGPESPTARRTVSKRGSQCRGISEGAPSPKWRDRHRKGPGLPGPRDREGSSLRAVPASSRSLPRGGRGSPRDGHREPGPPADAGDAAWRGAERRSPSKKRCSASVSSTTSMTAAGAAARPGRRTAAANVPPRPPGPARALPPSRPRPCGPGPRPATLAPPSCPTPLVHGPGPRLAGPAPCRRDSSPQPETSANPLTLPQGLADPALKPQGPPPTQAPAPCARGPTSRLTDLSRDWQAPNADPQVSALLPHRGQAGG